METRDFIEHNGERVYVIKFEELISNVFYMLNCSDVFIDSITSDLFDEYIKYTKAKFKQHGIEAFCEAGFWGHTEMERNGIFTTYKNDPKSDHYDGFKMLKHLSPEEYKEKYQNHPQECSDILINEEIQELIVSRFNSRHPYTRVQIPKQNS